MHSAGAPVRTAVSVGQGLRSGFWIKLERADPVLRVRNERKAAKAVIHAAPAEPSVYGPSLFLNTLRSGSVLFRPYPVTPAVPALSTPIVTAPPLWQPPARQRLWRTSMQTSVHVSTMLPPKDNPRKTLDQSAIAGLAQSIKTDGVLQNLLVRPEGEGTYRVIVGKRRYLALQHLKKRGDIDDSYDVPAGIKDELDEGDAIRLATVENVQREQLHPMDEAEAFAKQLQSGGTVEDIA